MRIRALAFRILTQIKHDKRTLGLILIAPLLIMTIIYFIFNASDTSLNIGVVEVPDSYIAIFNDNEDLDVTTKEYNETEVGKTALTDEEVVVLLDMSNDEPIIYIDGSEATKSKQAISVISAAKIQTKLDALPEQMKTSLETDEWDTAYLYGKEDSSMFDSFGAGMIGIVIFFLVFLIGGINFLGERTSGTLEKLLSTPIRRIEIVLGYVLGFGILAIIQSLVFTLFVVKVLNLEVVGSIWLLILIILLTSVTALTLGMVLSTTASSEFQMVQFIPIVIIPQIFLCGIFKLSGALKIAGYFMPLYYTTHALDEVILRGQTFMDVSFDLGLLFCLSVFFILINILLLKLKRNL
ncbi:MAG: ABC transporter permease [Peptostreptococcaceae bacterium]|nr:ABC transporter permease [Peptostreptococcaceae bacterium]